MSKGGKRANAGRKRGVQNKINTDLKNMILAALNEAGGQSYLLKQAKLEPKAFLALLGKVLPSEVKANVDLDGKLTINVNR